MEKNLTDKEIIKALEEVKATLVSLEDNGRNYVSEYPSKELLAICMKALNIINHQQAEIERLEKIRKANNNLITSLNKCYETAKAEAIKEFISCATYLCYKEFENDLEIAHIFASILAESQKEMVGENY